MNETNAASNSLRIEDEMTSYPIVVDAETTVQEASEIMAENKVRHLPVVDRDGKIVGIASDRDLQQAILLADSMHLLVQDVMTKDPYVVEIGTPIAEVARVMAENKFGSTIVLNRLGCVVGIFTTTDGMKLLYELLKDTPEAAQMREWNIEKFLDSGYLLTA